jgi:hypothetical protein
MITQQLLKELFYYRDGELYWKFSVSRNVKAGAIAGTVKGNGYRNIKIKSKQYLVHRIIFLYHHGYVPEFLDHINTNKLDNRIENLREATKEQNNRNCPKRKDNTSGIKGVHWDSATKKWLAKVAVGNGVQKYLGRYDDIELAQLVIEEARDKYHKEFAKHE